MVEKIAYRYLERLAKLPAQDTDTLHLLNEKELAAIDKSVKTTLLLAAFIGVVGVLLLYVPQYFFPELFFEYPVEIKALSLSFSLPIVALVYGLLLAYAEIYILMAVNIKAVFQIAKVCGFPDKNDPDYEKHLESLMRVGLEKEDKSSATYGLNPLQGASRWSIFIFLVLSRLKATLSNFVAKIILRRVLGRYALREIIDMVGIPVFAFWNAFASHIVIRETKVRIMAPNIIRQFSRNLFDEYENDESFKVHLYDTLQFITMSKRKFHHNHFLLAKNILQTFSIDIKDNHELKEDFLENLEKCTPVVKNGIVRVILIGFIIDGNLSMKESVLLDKLNSKGIIPYKSNHIKDWIESFVKGKGLPGLVRFGN